MHLQINQIPVNDELTWDLVCEGNTRGCFQIESPLGRHWCKTIKPRSVNELSDVIALIRPGCLEAFSGDPPKNLTRHYADRKHRLEEDDKTHPALKEILKDTYGILVYQEQAMAIASKLAGFSETDADTLRKGIGKKLPEVIAKLEGQFIDGCKKVGILNEEQAKEVFEWIRASQRYSFNKSHSTCYAMLGYRTAYCKAHYPLQFYCSYLRGSHWKQDTRKEIKELVEDAKKNGVEVKAPDARDLKETFYLKDDRIYFGLGDIKDIGASAIKKVFANIHKINSWSEFLFKFFDTVSITVVKALISSGALDYFKISRQEMLFEVELWNQLTDKEKEYISKLNPFNLLTGLELCVLNGCKLTRRKESISALIKLRITPPHSLQDKIEQIVFMEEKYLGAALTYSRLDACGKAPDANFTCSELSNGLGRKDIRIAVELTRVKEIKTKTTGDKMAFLEVSDNSGNFNEIVVFPEQWEEYKDILYETNLVLLGGYRGKKGVVIQKAWQI